MKYECNRRQFVLMNKPYEGENFITEKMSNGLYLSYHKDLKVTKIADSYVLGHAYSVLGEDINLKEDVCKTIRDWAGRWILVTESELYLDACGTLGVFYGISASNGMICSSSLAILHELVDDSEWISNITLHRGDFGLMDFYPAPYTPWQNCMRLLPSQKINLKKECIETRNDLDFSTYTKFSRKELKELILEYVGNVFSSVANEYGKAYLPLTSGVDSRTMLAIALNRNIRLNTYTVKRKDTPEHDYKIAEKLAQIANVPYQLMVENKTESEADTVIMDKIIKHCGGRISVGTEFVQLINELDVGPGNMILWGPTWEIGIHYYEKYFDRNAYKADKVGILQRINRRSEDVTQKSSVHKLSLETWADYILKNPVKGMNWMDRLYWEQRQGSWASYAFQLFDLLDSDRIIPVNCQRIIEVLMAFDRPVNTTNGKEVQRSIIKKIAPQIASIEYGPTKKIDLVLGKLKAYYIWSRLKFNK